MEIVLGFHSGSGLGNALNPLVTNGNCSRLGIISVASPKESCEKSRKFSHFIDYYFNIGIRFAVEVCCDEVFSLFNDDFEFVLDGELAHVVKFFLILLIDSSL